MHKKLLFLIIIIMFFSCKEKTKKKAVKIKDYVVFSGKIKNKNSDTITIVNKKLKLKKFIKVSEKGIFKDSFKIGRPSFLTLSDGTEYTLLYLKNGDEVSMTVDTKSFDKTIKFSGKGSKETSFLIKKFSLRDELLKHDAIYHIAEKSFNAKFNNFKSKFLKELKKIKNHKGEFVLGQKKELEKFKALTEKSFKAKENIRMKLKAGSPTPEFSEPCESLTEKKYSLKDFRGKYVYIEFWATWCENCKEQMPHTVKLAEKFKDKNIEFIGISVDFDTEYSKWKKICLENELPGIQLLCDDDNAFTQQYLIGEIPRFIILDPKGNIIDANAPQASDPNLITIFNNLGL